MDDFCILHGYEFMTRQFGNPIPYCAECDRIAQRAGASARKVMEDARVEADDLRKPTTI